jgi:hypothetical protein
MLNQYLNCPGIHFLLLHFFAEYCIRYGQNIDQLNPGKTLNAIVCAGTVGAVKVMRLSQKSNFAGKPGRR